MICSLSNGTFISELRNDWTFVNYKLEREWKETTMTKRH